LNYGLRSASPSHPAQINGSAIPSDRWQPRKEARFGGANGSASGPSARHGRQKSLGEAFRTIRTRKGSVSQNAHELADALKAPLSPKLIVCHSINRRG
jgi:solute carrier family 35 protein E1